MSNRKNEDPRVVVEYVPQKKHNDTNEGYRSYHYSHTYSVKRISPIRLAVMAVLSLVALFFLFIFGSIALVLAVGAGLAYLLWRHLFSKF